MEKFLVGNIPGGGHRTEITPAMVGAKLGGAIATAVEGDEITLVVIVIYAAKIGVHGSLLFVGSNGSGGGIAIIKRQIIWRRESRFEPRKVLKVVLFIGRTGQQLEAMFSSGQFIRKGIL